MIEIADRIAGIQEYYFSKKLEEIRKMKASGCEVINLGIGSPDMAPAKEVTDALVSSATKADTHAYQPYRSIPALREAMAGFYSKHYHVDLDPDSEVLPLLGSKEGIMFISMAFINPGDIVLVPNPGYPAYETAAKMMGAEVVHFDLKSENQWYPKLNEIDQASLKKAKIMWINYPNMPTGQKANVEVFEELARFAKANELLLINDNPYSMILNDEPRSLLASRSCQSNCIELNSMSKAFNMAGWRVGMVCGRSEYIDAILRAKSNMDSGMFRPVQEASISALKLSNEWFESLNKEYKNRRVLAETILDKLDCTFDTEQSGMFIWARIPDGFTSENFVDQLLQENHVFVSPGTVFGTNGEGYIRISLCSEKHVFHQVIQRLINIAV